MSKYEPVSAEVVAALQTALGAEYVRTDAETLEKYKTDEETDPRYHHLPEVVIWPGSTEEVAAVMKIANQYNVNLINNMEFLNDRYASMSLSYDMNGKLFNRIPLIKNLKWREMFRVRALWGTLTDKNNPFKSNNPDLFRFPTRDGKFTSFVMDPKVPYVEASVGIYNIFKLLHVEYVHRFTYRDNPGINKNGIRFMVLMVF